MNELNWTVLIEKRFSSTGDVSLNKHIIWISCQKKHFFRHFRLFEFIWFNCKSAWPIQFTFRILFRRHSSVSKVCRLDNLCRENSFYFLHSRKNLYLYKKFKMPAVNIKKVLVCDAVDESCIQLLKNNGIEVSHIAFCFAQYFLYMRCGGLLTNAYIHKTTVSLFRQIE